MAEQIKTGIPIAKTSIANALFGKLGERLARDSYELRTSLLKSHSNMLPATYAAYSAMVTLIWWIVGMVLGFVVLFIIIPLVESTLVMGLGEFGEPIYWSASDTLFIGLALFFFLLLPLLVAYLMWKGPAMKAKLMAPKIDRKLPYAASFVAAMAAANATPERIFMALAKQEEVYGQISYEAAMIYRDLNYLGKDLVSTLKMAVERAPSERLAEFFQGIVGTITAGGNLKLYFLNRAEYYSEENRIRVRQVIDKLALFAESYVVAAVAMPIFLMIIMVITLWVQTGGVSMGNDTLYLIVFAMLPLIQISFSALFYVFSKDVGV